MKVSAAIFIASFLLAGSAFAEVNVTRCKGQFLIVSQPSSQVLVDGLLGSSESKNILTTQVVSATASDKVYQVRAASPATLDSTNAIVEVIARLEGVLVECDQVVNP